VSKPIQILALGEELIALCEDGSIWLKSEYASGWTKLPEVREQTHEEVLQALARANRLGDALSGAIHGKVERTS
jgi:hypothetical protein